MNIGEKIKEARLKKGYSQEELGKLVGVQRAAVSKWENGSVVNIKRSVLAKLSEVLEIEPIELIEETPIIKNSEWEYTIPVRKTENQKRIEEANIVFQEHIDEEKKKQKAEGQTIALLYEFLTADEQNKVLDYIQQLLTERHIQTMARIERLKK